jgi:hypothetical protein
VGLIPAHGIGQTGTVEVPQSVKEVVSFPRLDNRLCNISVKEIVRTNPEPNDGLLRAQDINTEFLSFFSAEAKLKDKPLERIGREIYVSMRP